MNEAIVILAKAGIQVLNLFLQKKFKDWIPAFAGMTTVALCCCVLAASETTIRGGKMELINKGETVVFSGGVKLNRGPDQVEAHRMKTNKDRDKVSVDGNVRLLRRVSSTETWHGYGESGYYDTQNGAGYLMGDKNTQARVIHTEVLSSTMSRVVTVIADRIDFLRDTKRAFAKGSVQGNTLDPESGDRYEFWSDQADFDGEGKKLTLFGKYQPLVIQTAVDGRRTLRGDKIVYFTEERRMTSEGRSEAIFQDSKRSVPKK